MDRAEEVLESRYEVISWVDMQSKNCQKDRRLRTVRYGSLGDSDVIAFFSHCKCFIVVIMLSFVLI